jgi:hypothetical protein
MTAPARGWPLPLMHRRPASVWAAERVIDNPMDAAPSGLGAVESRIHRVAAAPGGQSAARAALAGYGWRGVLSFSGTTYVPRWGTVRTRPSSRRIAMARLAVPLDTSY